MKTVAGQYTTKVRMTDRGAWSCVFAAEAYSRQR
jgi:hypothetical protein